MYILFKHYKNTSIQATVCFRFLGFIQLQRFQQNCVKSGFGFLVQLDDGVTLITARHLGFK